MPVNIPPAAPPEVLLSDLRLLANAVDSGSLAGAARVMRLSATSVTRQIQRLEAIAGHRLLHRSGGRFALTEEGRELLLKIRGPLRVIDEAMAELTSNTIALQGRLRVTAPYNFGRTVVASMLASFLALHPEVKVTLQLSSRKIDLLADEADIAIRIGSPGNDQLIARRLTCQGVILCASPSYLAVHGVPNTLKDLSTHRLLDFRPEINATYFELVDADGHKRRIAPVHIALHSNEPDVLATAASHGAGIAVLPEQFAHKSIADGSLVVVLPGCGLPPLDVHALYAPGRRQSAKIRAFIDHLVTSMQA